MIIEFNHQEKLLLNKIAESYRTQTGDKPSLNYIMNLLRCHYEDNLKKEMVKILNKKVRDFADKQAEEGKLVEE